MITWSDSAQSKGSQLGPYIHNITESVSERLYQRSEEMRGPGMIQPDKVFTQVISYSKNYEINDGSKQKEK